MSTFRVQTSPLYPDEEFHFSRLYVQLLLVLPFLCIASVVSFLILLSAVPCMYHIVDNFFCIISYHERNISTQIIKMVYLFRSVIIQTFLMRYFVIIGNLFFLKCLCMYFKLHEIIPPYFFVLM
jgi:hypothetical protein